MNRKLAIAAIIGLALATSGCEMMGKSGGGGGDSYMSGQAAVSEDPAGSATLGTGSVSYTGQDRRAINSSAMVGD